MDNLDLIKSDVNLYIDPNGAVGSILAQNHKNILQSILNNTGKYTGFPFVSQKQLTVFSSGSLSWESNNLNNTSNFDIKVSKLTSDLNDIGIILDTLQSGSVLHFKDFKGKSAIFEYISHFEDVDGSANDIYVITIKGNASNPNYVYQVGESNISVINAYNKNMGFLTVNDYKNVIREDICYLEEQTTFFAQTGYLDLLLPNLNNHVVLTSLIYDGVTYDYTTHPTLFWDDTDLTTGTISNIQAQGTLALWVHNASLCDYLTTFLDIFENVTGTTIDRGLWGHDNFDDIYFPDNSIDFITSGTIISNRRFDASGISTSSQARNFNSIQNNVTALNCNFLVVKGTRETIIDFYDVETTVIKDLTGVVVEYAEETDCFGGGGIGTNLNYVPSPINGTIESSNGDNALLPLSDLTNAGLMPPDFYDSGYFAITLTDPTAGATYNGVFDGYFVRVFDMVTIHCDMKTINTVGTPTAGLVISGIPFSWITSVGFSVQRFFGATNEETNDVIYNVVIGSDFSNNECYVKIDDVGDINIEQNVPAISFINGYITFTGSFIRQTVA